MQGHSYLQKKGLVLGARTGADAGPSGPPGDGRKRAEEEVVGERRCCRRLLLPWQRYWAVGQILLREYGKRGKQGVMWMVKKKESSVCLSLWVCEGHGKTGCPTAVYKHDQGKGLLSHCHSFCLSVCPHFNPTAWIEHFLPPSSSKTCLQAPSKHMVKQDPVLSCPGIPERCCWQAVSAVQHTHTGHTEVKAGWR